ncbi:MAG: hypothetical protein AXA67_09285 [Methylothermaceae bacteria B42]|nr:MAG: hypothetical protein AXA67_09285 [Methylothermaceae bacteria B42]HHJ39498.1 DUF4440 domain-containing protein [Methylothermaceae bacterium]
MKKIVLFLALALGMANGFADDSKQVSEKMARDAVAQWNAVLHSGNIDALMRLYANNAVVLLPNGKTAKDKQAIRRFWKQLLDSNPNHFKLDLTDVIYAKDDTVVSSVRWVNKEDGLEYSYDGVIYNVFKRQADGSWKAQAQRWN